MSFANEALERHCPTWGNHFAGMEPWANTGTPANDYTDDFGFGEDPKLLDITYRGVQAAEQEKGQRTRP